MTNKLGRLDPAIGTIKEYDLPTDKSGPHGLVPDKDGNIWYSESNLWLACSGVDRIARVRVKEGR